MAGRSPSSFQLTRFAFLRALGAIYAVAFLAAARQLEPLIGERGLLPARLFLARVATASGSRWAGFLERPSVFWIDCSDGALLAVSWLGCALAIAVALGATNALVLGALWALYLSIEQVGQVFYGYGWELLLLEAGALAIFLAPLRSLGPFPERAPPERVVIWLLRWLTFRVMFGAGLIKLRGDECWRDLTCLYYHYETQPLPNPISWLVHQAPPFVHQLGVLWNHLVELPAPWLLLLPWRRAAAIGGLLVIAFQATLILSGNLSFLNWLTAAIALAALDDRLLARVLPARIVARAASVAEAPPPARWLRAPAFGYAALVVALSVRPTLNLLGREQVMNGSFDRLHLVNTYGAFGSVGRTRNEVILEGTNDPDPGDASAWREYRLPCQPGDPKRRPCVIAPYPLRADWQIWFAALSDPSQILRRQPWLVHLAWQLLDGEPAALRLLDGNPFPDHPPRFVRARLWEYHFTRLGDGSGAWWNRAPVGEYLPPVSREDSQLRAYVKWQGWPGAAE